MIKPNGLVARFLQIPKRMKVFRGLVAFAAISLTNSAFSPMEAAESRCSRWIQRIAVYGFLARAIVLHNPFVTPVRVIGASMEPNFPAGKILGDNRAAPRLHSIARG